MFLKEFLKKREKKKKKSCFSSQLTAIKIKLQQSIDTFVHVDKKHFENDVKCLNTIMFLLRNL